MLLAKMIGISACMENENIEIQESTNEEHVYDEYEPVDHAYLDSYIDYVMGDDINPDALPTISGDFVFHIPQIMPGELVLLGKLDFEAGDVYRLVISGGGPGVFVGVTNTQTAITTNTYTWRPFVAGLGSSALIVHHGHGYRYLYVGSSASPYSDDPTHILSDVSGRLEFLPDVPATILEISLEYRNGIAIDSLLGMYFDQLPYLGSIYSNAQTDMYTNYTFDSGIRVGVSDNRVVNVFVDFDDTNSTAFHFNGIGGMSFRDNVVMLFGDMPFMIGQGSSETRIYGNVIVYGYWLNDWTSFVRFFFHVDDDRVVGISYAIE